LNELVEKILPMLETAVGPRIALHPALDATHPIYADPSEIELAVINLVLNARDACAQGGTIVVSTSDVDVDRVRLCVRDDGEGIPPHLIADVFEPFVTTKGPNTEHGTGTGTGIGLATVKEIVEHARGTVFVVSAPGAGTTLCAEFPADPSAVPPAPLPVRRRAIPRAKGSVLVVEDDVAVLQVLRESLASAGYDVRIAASAESALEQLADTGHRFDLIVADVILPGASGVELARRVPSLPTLLISGHAEKNLDLGRLPRPGLELLRKPFSASDLVERAAALLSAARAEAAAD
jgi:hypothetical protein